MPQVSLQDLVCLLCLAVCLWVIFDFDFDFDLIVTLIWLLSHAELLEGFLSLVDLTWGPHVFTVHPVVCSVHTVGKPQTL